MAAKKRVLLSFSVRLGWLEHNVTWMVSSFKKSAKCAVCGKVRTREETTTVYSLEVEPSDGCGPFLRINSCPECADKLWKKLKRLFSPFQADPKPINITRVTYLLGKSRIAYHEGDRMP